MMTAPVAVFELSFPCPDRPLSENESRRLNHWQRSARLDPWKMAVRVALAQVSQGKPLPIAGVPCNVQMDLPFARNARRDPSNYVGTVTKAAVDVLVFSGHVWPDDSPEWVTVLEPNLIIGTTAVLRLIPRDLVSLSRAVLRRIDAGNDAKCAGCDDRLKFRAKVPAAERLQVIANVYDGATWLRVDHYHPACYMTAAEPCGPVAV